MVSGSISLLFELALLFIIATFLAYLVKLVKQPLIPAYILTGIVLGPHILGLVKDSAIIQTLSEIGLVFLLFLVGMEMDLKKLRKVGYASIIVGVLQVILTFIITFLVAHFFLGFSILSAIFLGNIVAFSSTMVVVKLLSDKNEIETLHGRLLVGILLVQDVIVILAMPFLTNLSAFSLLSVAKLVVGTLLLGVTAYMFSKLAVYKIFKFAAKSDELLFLLSLSVCFAFVLLAHALGFSIAIGAFIAGLTLANLPYHFDIINKVGPLKDFFSTVFFVSLGMQFVLSGLKSLVIPLIVFSFITIIIKPLIIMITVALTGYQKHTSFITGSMLGQVSEFSLILVMLPFVNNEVFSLTIILAVLTISLTTYILKFNENIFNIFSKRLRFLDRIGYKRHSELEYHKPGKKHDIVIVGCDRMGNVILKTLVKDLKKNVLVIDYNPEVVEDLVRNKVQCIYGDISNKEVLKRINFKQVNIVISTIPSEDDNKNLVQFARKVKKDLIIIVTAERLHEALNLYEAGADFVMLPRIVSGERLSMILDKQFEDGKHIKRLKKKHLKHLLVLDTELKSKY